MMMMLRAFCLLATCISINNAQFYKELPFVGGPLTDQLQQAALKHAAEKYNQTHLDKVIPLLTQFISPTGPGVSAQCQTDSKYYIEHLTNLTAVTGWALKMFDATGKLLPAGALDLSFLSMPGNINSCLEVDAKVFKGQYCLMYVVIVPKGKEAIKTAGDLHADTLQRLGALSPPEVLGMISKLSVQSPIRMGVCVPSSCSPGDVSTGLGSLVNQNLDLGNFNIMFFPGLCQTNDLPELLDRDYAVFGVVACFGLVVVIGTVLDLLLRFFGQAYLPELLLQIFQGFSLYTVVTKIFRVTPNKDRLGCINGIRFLSMSWVIIGHTYLSITSFSPFLANPTIILEFFDRFWMRLVTNATPSVDSFFLIGATLLAYLTLKELGKQQQDGGRSSCGSSVMFWVLFYVHRYLRLTGVYAMAIALNISLGKFLIQGPIGYSKAEAEACAEAWYTNLLYINNFNTALDKPNCMGHTWYMANDMQMFILSPPLIYLMHRMPKIGMAVVAVLVSASTGLRAYLFDTLPEPDQFDNIYSKPWTRFGAYGIGLMLGCLLYMTKDSKKPINKLVVILGWLVSLITMFCVIYVYHRDEELTQTAFVIYQSVHRNVWSLALAWMIFACAKGYGGPIDKFLSWGFWAPLAKLSYSCYLMHFAVLYFASDMPTYRVMVSQPYMVYLCVANIAWAMFAGFLMVVLFEAPTMHMEKLLFGFLGVAKLPSVVKYKLE